VRIEGSDLGPDHVLMDIAHVHVDDDKIGLQWRHHVLEVKVVEDRRIAGHASVDDLNPEAARSLHALLQALGHRFRVFEAAALGERIAQDGDPEDASRLRHRELAVT